MHGDFRLGFVSGRMCSRDGDQYWSHSGLSRLVGALRERVAHLTAAVSVSSERLREHDQLLPVSSADFVPLPPIPSAIAGFLQDKLCRRAFAEVERRSDLLVVQLPFSPPSALAPAATPRVYHVCADVPGVVRASPNYVGLKRLAAVGAAETIHLWTRNLVHRQECRVVTNGRALFERLGRPRGVACVSSTLLDEEIGSVVRTREAGAPFRLLFVGYLRPEKGIDVLFEAYRRLLDQIPEAELRIVGEQDLTEDGGAKALQDGIRGLQGRGSVRHVGLLPFGPELFAEFANADALALPSRSEGTPRVLVEARAFGCPVVASRVGGIPTSVSDGDDGLVVPPNDAHALHQALLRIAREEPLRKRLIDRGFDTARRSTVATLADHIVGQLLLLSESSREAS